MDWARNVIPRTGDRRCTGGPAVRTAMSAMMDVANMALDWLRAAAPELTMPDDDPSDKAVMALPVG